VNYNQDQIELQMARIQRTGVRMQAALERAEPWRVKLPSSFRIDVKELMRKLNGEPGDGALETFRDLERDIGATQAFIADWEHDTTPEIHDVVSIVQCTEQQLKLLQKCIKQYRQLIVNG
jgi:hypothetical protein